MKKSTLALAVALGAIAQHAGAAGFIEDSKATLGLRNFYINTDNRDGQPSSTSNTRSKNAEWGQGFDLRFISGFTQGTVQFGVDAIGLYGVRLDSSRADHGNYNGTASGGVIFPSDGNKAVDDYASLGVTGKVKISQTVLKIGTLMPNNPVIKYNDGRLLPQTFQGGEIVSNDIKDLTLTAGQIEHSKGRNSSNNEGLSLAGANSSYANGFVNKFYYAGADYKVTKDLTASYYYGELKDFYSQNFLGLVHNWAIGPGVLKSDLRYYRSRDNGANANTSGYFTSGYYDDAAKPVTSGKVDNDLYSYLALYSVSGHTFGGGYQYTKGDSDFPWLNQGDGSSASITTDMQIQKFARAGERTWQARYAYDFAQVGVPGLTAGVVYLKGTNIQTTTGDKSEWERDISLAYVVPQGPLKNLGVAWKNAMWRTDVATRDQDENRLIVSYSIPLL